jgi:hypothetical protein
MKRAQISIYIIVGLVLLIGMGLIFYLAGIKAEVPIKEHTNDDAIITKYIESYLEMALTEGLNLSMNHGGYIESIDLVSNTLVEGEKIPLAIKAIRLYTTPYYYSNYGKEYIAEGIPRKHAEPVPGYPWAQFTVDNPPINDPYTLGEPLLIALESSSVNEFSIQSEVEAYMYKKLAELDLSSFDYLGIETGQPTLQILFTGKSAIAELHFPVNITTKDGKVHLERFYAESPINIRDFYTFITDNVLRDATDISYNLSSDWEEIDSFRPGYNVSIREYSGFDVITFNYSDRVNYQFNVIRENRIPALYSLVVRQTTLGTFCQNKINISGTIIEQPIAVDPDEDATTIHYDLTGCPFDSFDPLSSQFEIDCSQHDSGEQSCSMNVSVRETESALRDWEVVDFSYVCDTDCS